MAIETRTYAVENLRWLVDTYYQTQKLRIQLSNRLSAVERDVDMGPAPASARLTFDRLESAEDALIGDMEEALEGHPALVWLAQVKGIGPVLSAKLLGLIGDISRFDTVSKLWRFAGFAVIDGVRERPTKGEKLHYSIRLKTTCYLVAGSFLKCGSPYRAIYDRARAHYEIAHPENGPEAIRWTKGHQHLAALRKMEKMFLSHLWQTWREALGLPIRAAYVQEYLGHTTVEDPWKYVRE